MCVPLEEPHIATPPIAQRWLANGFSSDSNIATWFLNRSTVCTVLLVTLMSALGNDPSYAKRNCSKEGTEAAVACIGKFGDALRSKTKVEIEAIQKQCTKDGEAKKGLCEREVRALRFRIDEWVSKCEADGAYCWAYGLQPDGGAMRCLQLEKAKAAPSSKGEIDFDEARPVRSGDCPKPVRDEYYANKRGKRPDFTIKTAIAPPVKPVVPPPPPPRPVSPPPKSILEDPAIEEILDIKREPRRPPPAAPDAGKKEALPVKKEPLSVPSGTSKKSESDISGIPEDKLKRSVGSGGVGGVRVNVRSKGEAEELDRRDVLKLLPKAGM